MMKFVNLLKRTKIDIRRNVHYKSRQEGESKIKRPIIVTTITIPIVITSTYLIYQTYFKEAAIYPEEIKRMLRKALISEHRAEFITSHVVFEQAYQESKRILLEQKSPTLDPVTLAGIGIRWAASLERRGLVDQSIRVYEMVFEDLSEITSHPPSHANLLGTIRSIELAQKIAQLLSAQLEANVQSNKNEIENKIEKFLCFCVEEILKLPQSQLDNSGLNNPIGVEMSHQMIGSKDGHLDQNELPSWVGRLNQASCFESLGSFYARRGKIEYALPLYLQTLNILVPVKFGASSTTRRRQEPTDETSCQAATVMNNIASLLIQQYDLEQSGPHHRNANSAKQPDPSLLKNSKSWLLKSLHLSARALDHHTPANHAPLLLCRDVHHMSTTNLINLDKKLREVGAVDADAETDQNITPTP